MLILFDQNVHRGLRRLLKGHIVRTSHERGWANLKNGLLLDIAERADFDVLITSDKNLEYQQNLSTRVMSIIVLGSGQWPQMAPYLDRIVDAVNGATRNSYAYIDMPLSPPASEASITREDASLDD